ncbi:MAG: DUF2330 domain-containing protein [Brachybacterium sp.]|nr:DUF2330 domain-containing protein [Brachybacterium sp.]
MLLAGLVLLAQTALGAASPAGACACGGFVDPADRPDGANVMKETAVLSLRAGVATIVMGLALDAERIGSTLLMPTPSVPEVSAGQSGTLREMTAATAPREEIDYDYWGENPFDLGGGDEAGGAPETEDAGQPTVHSQERIGNYEVAVLGGDAEGVRSWLTENGYALDAELSALIDPYAEDGWTFTAIRYAEDAVLSGDVEPLRFDFATDELIYPMRFSQAAETAQHVHLFVLAETPMRRSDASAEEQQVDRPWIGSPTHHDWTWSDATLRELAGVDLGDAATDEESPVRFRTVTEFEIRGEPESFTTDLTFAADPGAEDVIPTVTTTKLVAVMGIPVGWLRVLAGIVNSAAILIAVGATARAGRARRGAEA